MIVKSLTTFITKPFTHTLTRFALIPEAVELTVANIDSFQLHNDCGPALIIDTISAVKQHYMLHGLVHRYDGPAKITSFATFIASDPQYEWYIRGNKVNHTEYYDWLVGMDMDMNNLTEEDKMLIDLKWGYTK